MEAPLTTIVLLLSIAFQAVAAALAFRLAQESRAGWGWLLISAALILMGIRRALVLGEWWLAGAQPILITETVALMISTLALVGVWLIRPSLTAAHRYTAFLAIEAQRLNSVLEGLPGLVYRCRNDPQWTMEFISEGCRSLTGYLPEDLLGNRRVSYAELIEPEDRETVYRAVQEAVAERRPYRMVYRIRAADGTVKWVWEQGQGIFDRDGDLLCLQGYISDVTEWQKIQQEFEQVKSAWEQDRQQWREQEGRLLHEWVQRTDHLSEILAYEIHDGFVQQASAALMHLQSFDYVQRERPDEAAAVMDRAVLLLRQAIAEARRMIDGLRPAGLDRGTLIDALRDLCREMGEQSGIPVRFTSDVESLHLAPPVENNLYRIVQEAVHNAAHHSGSQEVEVRLSHEGSRVNVVIRDWGQGFNPAEVPTGHFGLAAIRDRARMLGGSAQIVSAPGRGTTVRVTIPLNGDRHVGDAPDEDDPAGLPSPTPSNHV
ncbi:sensor histidine kinase [Thermopirellula anaerolimosa]